MIERTEKRLALFDMILVGQRWEGAGPPQKLGYKLLTLTTRTPYGTEDRFNPEGLRKRAAVMRGHFRQFWRLTDWGRQIRDPITKRKRSRRDTAFVLALEAGPGGNVHLHVLVFGEFIPQASLQHLWSDIVGDLAIVDVRDVAGRDRLHGALSYVLKYVLKAPHRARPRPEDAAAVEYALRRVRRVEIGGALRATATAHSTGPEEEEARPAEVMESQTGACENCGKVGWWSWKGRVAPSEVEALGGFGLLRLEPDPDEEERRALRGGA